MAIIEGMSEDVPLIQPPIQPNIYVANIDSCDVKENKDKNGHNMVTVLKIVSDQNGGEVPDAGRILTSYISLKQKTNLARVAASAGITGWAGDTTQLVGRRVTIVVNTGPYTDPQTKEQRITNNIKEFVIPKELEDAAKQAIAAKMQQR